MEDVLKFLFATVAVVAIAVLFALLLIKVGWYLFMVPVFNLPNLTWMQAFGFSLLTGAFRSSSVKKE